MTFRELLDKYRAGQASEEERAENVNIGISVEKGNTSLLNALNDYLSTMTADDFNALMDEAIAVQPEI